MAKVPAVLIVDENDDNRVELRKLLARAGLEVAGDARYGASAAVVADETRPDAIVVGIEEPPNRALETIEALSQLLVDTPIVAYSSLTEIGAVRRATRAGARDFLTQPLEVEGLREAIGSALRQEEQRRLRRMGVAAPPIRGSVITVTGAKGGVGKSIVAINLAIALRQITGRTVALVDCDTHFGDVSIMLDLRGGPSVTDSIAMGEKLERSAVLERTIEHHSGVRVFAGPPDPEDWEGTTPEDLESFIGLLAETFDFVVIDTPDVFDRLVERSVLSSTLVLLVTSFDLSSIADTKVALRILRRWGCQPENVRLVANHTRGRDGLGERHLTQALNWPVFWTVPYDKHVPSAAQVGDALVEKAPRSGFSRRLRELAGAISGSGRTIAVQQPAARLPDLRSQPLEVQ